MSYLTDFLFSPERANSPVRTLSGGERNRVLLARLFALPANVLVLDEPTNDLDIDTLELLEELLQAYAGTVFLVSHDRRFLDNVVTSTIAWEGDPAFGGRQGLWREYEGGYEDWKVQRARSAAIASAASQGCSGKDTAATAPAPAKAAAPRSKLSYKDQRELDALPARIDALEQEQKRMHERLASNTLYTQEPQLVPQLQARNEAIEEELMAALERWEALGGAPEAPSWRVARQPSPVAAGWVRLTIKRSLQVQAVEHALRAFAVKTRPLGDGAQRGGVAAQPCGGFQHGARSASRPSRLAPGAMR
jgi:ATP-binding cassette subfamily F protein uup